MLENVRKLQLNYTLHCNINQKPVVVFFFDKPARYDKGKSKRVKTFRRVQVNASLYKKKCKQLNYKELLNEV